MDNIPWYDLYMMKIKKQDGFRDEQYFIIPTETFENYANHPLVKKMYLTDVGYFPKASNHYREREEGIEEYILIYCVEGEGFINIDNKSFNLKQNEVFCIPKHRKHCYYSSEKEPWSIFWVHFKGEDTKYFPLEDLSIININSKNANTRLVFLFDFLFRVLDRNYTQGNFIYMSEVLSLILAEIYMREKVDESPKSNKHLTIIIRYMYNNISKNLTLEELSSKFNLSKSYINAIFKTYTKKSPIDFFINIKMQEACKILRLQDMNINEVAMDLGYTDQYYFSRIFKKTIGVSPKKYKTGL